MPLDQEYESFFALILSEELDSVDNAREILHRQEVHKSSANQQRNHVEVDFKDVLPIVIKTGEPVNKKRKKGGRSQEDYLQKGGMLAFYDLNDFRSHFGMTRSQVEDLLTDLQPHYHYERGSKLPLENVVLASLWVLASQESYRVIAERFKTSKSVICTSLHHFCTLVSANLEHMISWPSGSSIGKTVRGFENAGFPGTLGAIDACQISINKPKDVEEPEAYMNEKNVYCTTLLAVCDHECRFTYVNVGHPGTFDDADVFRRSELYEAFQDDPHSLLPLEYRLSDKVYCYHILADAGFPLSETVMTPFDETGYQTGKERLYNSKHFSGFMVISKAIGLLKGRFRRLRLLLMQHLAQCSVAIKACCILHNMCLENTDTEPVNIEEEDLPFPPRRPCSDYQINLAGEAKRNAIAASFI
ncbi:putative nuclease HARBI1 [Penaeus monodon]|uniref:putative nuclease HARBI1 n=1 Tax=Penaeus monodon TaxID=6687 RepID=UPI0018A71C3F|nr:putative nuclease HARBI1 [Penaeus monodon]